MNYDKIQSGLGKVTSSIGSILKVMLLSKGISARRKQPEGSGIVIMGNGPSLRKTIDTEREWLEGHELMGGNFFAYAPDFTTLRTRYFVFAEGV
ncbi:MAG: hypothetical protein K2K58_04835, partial [Muribaculaceae bacterium]|nr:hypothetical protein [Muribaculaceae bacterium]